MYTDLWVFIGSCKVVVEVPKHKLSLIW
jgi:hypothetical protein